MKTIFFIVLSFVYLIPTHAQDPDSDYTTAIEVIEVWLEAQKDYENLPGISAVAVKDQAIIWKGAFGYANIENKVEAEPETIYSICSISKLFTAIAIMKLYDEGKLRLDDNIEDLLPHFNLKQKYSDSGPITIRTLLTHSSGLPRESAHSYWSYPDFPFPSKEEIKEELGTQETLYPASTYFQYSNLALTLLGQVIEEISGQSYENYIQENILTPLGLKNTRTYLPEDKYGSQLSIGYGFRERNGERPKLNLFQADGITPAAGFSSNVEDLAKFASWQFRLLDSTITEILKPSTLKNMHRVHYTDPGWNTTWGLGFSVRKNKESGTSVGHGGSCPGYQTTLTLIPKTKTAYSVMINGGGTSPASYAQAIDAIFSKLTSKKAEDAVDDGKEEKDFSDMKGCYKIQPWWGEEYFTQFEDQLISISLPNENPGNGITKYKHIEGDTFRVIRSDKASGHSLEFQRNASGKVVSYISHNNIYKKIN